MPWNWRRCGRKSNLDPQQEQQVNLVNELSLQPLDFFKKLISCTLVSCVTPCASHSRTRVQGRNSHTLVLTDLMAGDGRPRNREPDSAISQTLLSRLRINHICSHSSGWAYTCTPPPGTTPERNPFCLLECFADWNGSWKPHSKIGERRE